MLCAQKHTQFARKFAQTIGKMLALYPMRCFTELRLKELKDKEKCSKSVSWASERYGEDVDWFDLTPSFIQRMNWSMDDDSKRFLSLVFEPLPFEIVTKMILETIVLNSHDMSIGGFGLGFHTSFVNHSCWPNADVQNSEPTKGMVIRAVRDIEPGERFRCRIPISTIYVTSVFVPCINITILCVLACGVRVQQKESSLSRM